METLTNEEKKEFQDILSVFYGNQAYSWNINLKVLKLLEQLLRKNEDCNKYMDKVPRPFYFGNALNWASKQARNAVIRHIKGRNKSYYICLKGSAIGMRTKFQLASMGI
ncbi:hypothetical protein [Endozoicomonas numazuensis]|uniref:Uncharacterized protein n=1 Tax=Endozoicomonas numazuensis TaxID=1137799 RepID=A0A081NJS8_9GAMM|nr:hypothetical protein [Endozoicomonas numazuensis]KEQ18701.1 hypothetical protein GZ78_00865 [Endozoicomonas numazuensis]